MSIYKKLAEIQQKLKAPKGQLNKFGGYKYRSCEDILEAVKPLLGDMTLTISDALDEMGGRVYICAVAKLSDGENCITTQAYARESETKKGMDESQITGSASSYARKYALNGLFLIDDQKDADSQDNRDSAPVAKSLDINKVLSALTDAKDSSELERLYKAAKSRATPEQLEVIDFTYNSIKGATA